MEWLRDLVAWTTDFAQTPYGAWALFAIAFAESSFFPIPPDLLLMALAAVDPERSLWYATVTTVGSVLGGMFGYFVGIKGGRPFLLRLFKHDKVRVVEDYYHRYDVWAVGIAGLTPIPYKVFTIAAGVFAINFPRFVAASLASRGLRFFAEGFLFWLFGPEIQAFVKSYFEVITISFAVLLVGGFYLLRVMGKHAHKQHQQRNREQ
ncbi:MAG: YqaA family protein [Thermodesulfobacteriota bacterium]